MIFYLVLEPNYKNHSEDITGNIIDEEKAVKSVGCKIKYTEDITFSSSNLLNKFGDIYNEAQKSFIQKLLKGQDFEGEKKHNPDNCNHERYKEKCIVQGVNLAVILRDF